MNRERILSVSEAREALAGLEERMAGKEVGCRREKLLMGDLVFKEASGEVLCQIAPVTPWKIISHRTRCLVADASFDLRVNGLGRWELVLGAGDTPVFSLAKGLFSRTLALHDHGGGDYRLRWRAGLTSGRLELDGRPEAEVLRFMTSLLPFRAHLFLPSTGLLAPGATAALAILFGYERYLVTMIGYASGR